MMLPAIFTAPYSVVYYYSIHNPEIQEDKLSIRMNYAEKSIVFIQTAVSPSNIRSNKPAPILASSHSRLDIAIFARYNKTNVLL